MPNWIINRICAKGETADLKKLINAIHGENEQVDFDRIYSWRSPISDEQLADEWGTGPASDIKLDPTTVVFGFVVIEFETPWSPPASGLLRRLKERFPDIMFVLHAYDFDYHAEAIIYGGRDVDELERSWMISV